MRRVVTLVAVALLGFALFALTFANAPSPIAAMLGQNEVTPTPMQSFAGKVRAPEFPPELDWINVPAPLTMSQLRGKAIILDFWTYGCINCIHVIPDYKRLEAEFSNELVVIGVHSAKFANEGETENIRRIVKRYAVEHPVVNDRSFQIWQTYGVRAWPTAMLIDPQGKVLGYYSGEGVYDALQPVIKGMIAEFDAQGLINREPLKVTPELAARAPSLLAYPGKVLADPVGQRLFIADTSHNRIVIADLDTFAITAVIGSGTAGLRDGDFSSAQFNWVHGLSLNDTGSVLYVADTGNHALRAVNLTDGTVTTLAGIGEQNRDWSTKIVEGKGTETALNSPWDVYYRSGIVYIAMAGPHQIWAYDIATGIVRTFAGSGREGLVDGALLDTELAQPSGIIGAGDVIYFADAEASAIRKIDLTTKTMSTLVGTGLFDFGDQDGIGEEVLLQHALGLTVADDGRLYIADTYNHKIKVLDPTTREVKSLFGSAEGNQDGAAPKFWEPGGISYANGKLYIADTNNDAIRVANLATGEVTTVVFPNPERLQRRSDGESALNETPPTDFFGEVVTLPAIEAAPGQSRFVLNVVLPDGYKLNAQAPFTLTYYNDNVVGQVAASDNNFSMLTPPMPVVMPITLTEGTATFTLDAAIFYCEAVNESLCFPLYVRFIQPITVKADAATEVNINYTVTPPKLP